ncbi:MAG: sensor histidine kinase [Clostridium sp.]
MAKVDESLCNEIVPIITGKTQGDFEKGESILKKYSYNESLKPEYNHITSNTLSFYNNGFLIILLLTLIFIVLSVLKILSPLFENISYLTRRAEGIVEGRFLEEEERYYYKGSLEKLNFKFSQMEGRINNSIDLLKKEKINLKNIINDISHQLKTPLTALSMYNDILKDHREMKEEEVDDFINLSKEQLDRMEWLVKTLLKYARLESNVVEYKKEILSLSNTIEESMSGLRVKAEEKNQILEYKCNEDVLFLHDRKWIAESLSNIIKNGIEHTGINGRITITLEETPLSIVIKIKDNGRGIEKSEQRKIFNRFHKGENSLDPKSIGIGLCLSKSIIASHNGDITVDSEVGKGSTFIITFLKNIY